MLQAADSPLITYKRKIQKGGFGYQWKLGASLANLGAYELFCMHVFFVQVFLSRLSLNKMSICS